MLLFGEHQGFVLELLFSPSFLSLHHFSSSFPLLASDKQKSSFHFIPDEQKTFEGNDKEVTQPCTFELCLYLNSLLH